MRYAKPTDFQTDVYTPLVPRYSVPEAFQRALSYEGQIQWLAHACSDVIDYVSDGLASHVVKCSDRFDAEELGSLPGTVVTLHVTGDAPDVVATDDFVYAVVTDATTGSSAAVIGSLASADRGNAPADDVWAVACYDVIRDAAAIDGVTSDALGARIDAEAAARSAADDALGARIDAVGRHTFATVDAMKSASLAVGDVAVTSGFHTPGVGGATYVVKAASDETANGMSRVGLDDGAVACACFTDSVTPSQLGYTSGNADQVLAELVTVAGSQGVTARMEGATYPVTGTLVVTSGVRLVGAGVNQTVLEQQTVGATTVKVQASASSETYATGVTLRDFTVTYKAEEWRTDGSVGVDVLAGSYLVENVNVRYHATGFKVRALPGGEAYNPIVHLGENRLLTSCTVYGADTGIENAMQDGFITDCAIGSADTYGINNTGGLQMSNVHIWAIKQYGIANSGTLDASNVMIESNPHSTAANMAWVRLWGGRACFSGLHIWNIQKPVGSLIYQNAGVATFSGMNITRCPADNADKVCPPIVYIGESALSCSIDFTIDDTYASIKGNGYTNHGCTLRLTGITPPTSSVSQSFVTKEAGTYTGAATKL